MAALITTEGPGLAYSKGGGAPIDMPGQALNNTSTMIRPTFLQYRRRVYILGKFNPQMMVTEALTKHQMGIEPPTQAPVLAASGTGITGTCFGYTTFLHKLPNGVVVHESNPSPVSNTIALTNQGRAWSNIQTTSPNARVTHVRGYVSVNGASSRVAWERTVGVSTVTEATATLALGEQLSIARGVPPYAVFGELYHDRIWYVDGADRTKIWYSELEEPESVSPLNFFTTWDGDFVTGIKKTGDVLVIFTRGSAYALTGWDATDFTFRKISPSVGCISHHSIVDINGKLWFASQDGVFMYNGQFHNMMKDMTTYWRDAYLSNTAVYENSIAADDKFWHTYKLLIPEGGPVRYYVGHYRGVEPELEGDMGQPDWVFDIRDRNDYTMGFIRSGNSRRDEFYTGSCDGYVRKENVEADNDDDGDTYQKAALVRFKHFLMDDAGGDITEGKRFDRLWTYVQSENGAWTLKMYGGDEWAGDGPNPQWLDSVDASFEAGSTGTNLVTTAASNFNGVSTYNWTASGGNTITNDTNTLKITYVNDAAGARALLKASTLAAPTDLTSNLAAGTYYRFQVKTRVGSSQSVDIVVYGDAGELGRVTVTNTVNDTYAIDFLCDTPTGCYVEMANMDGTDTIWLDEWQVRELQPELLPKTVHVHKPTLVTGRGLTVKIEATAPPDLKVRGFGGNFGRGTTFRGPAVLYAGVISLVE
jgi:hypothetical protein